MCMGLFGSRIKALTHGNPEDQSVKRLYPKYMLDDVPKKKKKTHTIKTMLLQGLRMGGNPAPVREDSDGRQRITEFDAIWWRWEKGFSKELEHAKYFLNALAYVMYVMAQSFPRFLNPPLHNQVACCYIRNLLLWATINIVLMATALGNSH